MCAWAAANPSNDSLLVNFPANCRANWDAIVLGTDASLQITNAKVAAGAAIVESKITFSGSGHAHTGTTNGIKIALASAVSGTLPYGNGGTSFRAGDLMLSSNSSAPTGWADVSATYTGRMIRISSGTPEQTGGSDTHTHSSNTGSHTLTAAQMPAHTHTVNYHYGIGGQDNGPYIKGGNASSVEGTNTSSSIGGGTGHTHSISLSATNNIPAYVQERLFKMN